MVLNDLLVQMVCLNQATPSSTCVYNTQTVTWWKSFGGIVFASPSELNALFWPLDESSSTIAEGFWGVG